MEDSPSSVRVFDGSFSEPMTSMWKKYSKGFPLSGRDSRYILCLTSVEIYSSRQELKFDTPLPSNTENGNARSDYGPPGEGDGSWYFGGSGCVKFSHNNCAAEAHNNCEGFTTQPGHPE